MTQNVEYACHQCGHLLDNHYPSVPLPGLDVCVECLYCSTLCTLPHNDIVEAS